MWRRTIPTVALLVAALAILEGRAAATTVEAMSLEEMARRADFIVVGEVRDLSARWNAARTRIDTYVTLAVERFLKGETGEGTVTVRVFGGSLGAFRVVVPGSPRFVPGESVLVFAAGARARVPTVLGLSLGKFTLTRSAAGETIVKRDISSLMLARHRTDAPVAGSPPVRFRLAEVEARVRAALAR